MKSGSSARRTLSLTVQPSMGMRSTWARQAGSADGPRRRRVTRGSALETTAGACNALAAFEDHALAGEDLGDGNAGDDGGSGFAGGVTEVERDHAHAAADVTPHAGHSAETAGGVVKADGGGAGVEGAGVGSDDALAEIGDLEALVAEVALDELGHGPVEEQTAGFFVDAEASVDLGGSGWFAEPDVGGTGGTQGVAEAAEDVVHGAPAFDVAGGKAADFFGAAVIVIPKLDGGAVEKGNEEAVDGGRPMKAAEEKAEFFDDKGMEQTGEIGARRHAHAGKRLLEGAGSADAGAAFEDEDAQAGAGEIGGADEAVVAGADDDDVPRAGGERADGGGKADLTEDLCGWRVHLGFTVASEVGPGAQTRDPGPESKSVQDRRGVRDYCLMTVPSGRRMMPQPPFRPPSLNGALAASFSSISIPQPGFSLTHKIAVAPLRAALEDGLRALIEWRVLLNAEVVADEIEGDVGHVADGRDVAGAVPGGFDAELLGQDGDFAAGSETAGFGDVDADVVDEAAFDERLPFVGAVEELAHGDGGSAVLANLMEVGDVFRRERVFEEEHVVLLGFFAEFDGLIGGVALVHVVEELDFVAQFFAGDFKHLEAAAHSVLAVEERAGIETLDGSLAGVLRAVAGQAGQAHLDADVAEALGHVFFGVFDDVGIVGSAGVAVGVGSFAALAAGELIDGHVGLAAFDVPEGLVDAGDGVVEDGAVAPIGAVVAGKPNVLNAVRGFAEKQGLEIAIDGGLDEIGALGKGGAAVAVEAVLIGGDFDHGKAHALGLALDNADVFDVGLGHTAGGVLGLFLSGGEARSERKGAGSGNGFQEIAAWNGHF